MKNKLGPVLGLGLGLVVVVIVIWFAAIAIVASSTARDDSDPIDGRSDMRSHTDALTGCQYLESRQGGLAPRMDSEGRHICKKGTP